MKRKGKIIGIWILAAIMWLTFCPSNLYAEETEKIAIEKMEEFSSCEYPVGTSKEDIVAGLPERNMSWKSHGKYRKISIQMFPVNMYFVQFYRKMAIYMQQRECRNCILPF